MMMVAGVLIAGTVLFVVWPMLSEATLSVAPESFGDAPGGRSPVLSQIEDLDLEYAAGKIPEASYKKVRDDLIREAALALQPAAVTFATAAGDQAVIFKCSACGTIASDSDRFCSNCGGAL